MRAEEEKCYSLLQQLREKDKIIEGEKRKVKELESEKAIMSALVESKQTKIDNLEDSLSERFEYERQVILDSKRGDRGTLKALLG
jgi:ribosomal protein L7Ae-like RNA K-turn-binding protein